MSEDVSDPNIYPLDTRNPAELARLINQDRFVTQAMGGSLADIPAPIIERLETIADIACGPGGWAIDIAFSYPHTQTVGIDISQDMINYANARAQSQHLPNVSFEVMNVLKPLAFADESFDLVNARFLIGVLPRAQWPAVLAECTRILKPGGILRWTESVDSGVTSSQAFEHLQALTHQALWKLGFGFSPTGRTLGITFILPQLLRNASYKNVQINAHALEFSAGSDYWADGYRNSEIIYKLGQAGMVAAGVATSEELEELYQQMLIEMNDKNFCGMWHFVSVQGQKPSA